MQMQLFGLLKTKDFVEEEFDTQLLGKEKDLLNRKLRSLDKF